MLNKDFDGWNIRKKRLEREMPDTLLFHEREIWWCSIGLNIGDEQDGKNRLFERPVLVIKKFNNKVAWALPLSTNGKDGRYHHLLSYDGVRFSVILSQLRLISAKRLLRYVRKITPDQMKMIRKKLIIFLQE